MVDPGDNSIDQLLSLFNHELRTPITCLQGAIELLQTYQQTHQLSDPAELNELLNLAATSTDRLIHAIETILDWYEITQVGKTLFRQACNVALLLQQAVAALYSCASDRHIHITLSTPDCIPVNADERYLSRTLSYLIHNAIKFSPPDRPIHITVTQVQTPDSCVDLDVPHVLIAIQDQGIGIPEAHLNNVFQPFHQVHTADDRRYGGLGLELAICREVIQRHQGKIWVESQLGQGSTFSVALPLDESALPRLSRGYSEIRSSLGE